MLACLYDVHGNLPALDAVLEDARAQGADAYLLGGDYALFGGWPAETLDRLEGLQGAIWIRGNVDRWTADPAQAPDSEPAASAIPDCRAALGDARARALIGLPQSAALRDGSLAVHASPRSDMESFLPAPAEQDEALLEGVSAPRLIFGHTHLAFRRRVAGVELLNPGSVGMPLDGDHRASYALIGDDGRAEHRRVAYDHGASAQRVRDAFGDAPWVGIISARLEQARLDAS